MPEKREIPPIHWQYLEAKIFHANLLLGYTRETASWLARQEMLRKYKLEPVGG